MQKIKFLFTLFAGAVLATGCSNELLDNAGGGGKEEQPATPIAQAVFETGQVGMPAKDNGAKGTRAAINIVRDESSQSGLNGKLDYTVGNDMDVQLIFVIKQKDGTQAELHAYKGAKISQLGDKFYLAMKQSNETIYDVTSSTADPGKKWVARGLTSALTNAYAANPEQATIYLAAIVGGGYGANHAKYGSMNYFDIYPTMSPWPSSYSSFGRDANYDSQGYRGFLKPGYKGALNIPLTTGKWIKLNPSLNNDVLNYKDNLWKINLSKLNIEVKPYGSLIGFVYTSSTPVIVNSIQFDFIEAGSHTTHPNFRSNNGISFPMDTNISFDTNDLEGDDPVLAGDSYWMKNSSQYSGAFKVDYWSCHQWDEARGYYRTEPLFFWTHSTQGGDVSISVNLTPLVWGIPPGGAKEQWFVQNDAWVPIKSSANSENIAAQYYKGVVNKSYKKSIIPLQSGKSYTAIINPPVKLGEKANEGLIITELYHDNPSRLSNPDNYSMIELYNPTDHPIDLRYFGLIRTPSYNSYFFMSQGETANLADATVQDLYVEDQKYGANDMGSIGYVPGLQYFNKPVLTMSGRDFGVNETKNRFKVIMGNFDGILEPGQTCIYTASHWLWSDDPIEGNKDHAVPTSVSSSIRKAIKDGSCRFVVAVDNGIIGKAQANTSAGYKGGVLQHRGADGMILVRRKTLDNYAFEMYDALGTTTYDNGGKYEIANINWRQWGPSNAGQETFSWARYYGKSPYTGDPYNNAPQLKWYRVMKEAQEVSKNIIYSERPDNFWFNTQWSNDFNDMVTWNTGGKIGTSLGYRDYKLVK